MFDISEFLSWLHYSEKNEGGTRIENAGLDRRDRSLRISAKNDLFSLCRLQQLNKRKYAYFYNVF